MAYMSLRLKFRVNVVKTAAYIPNHQLKFRSFLTASVGILLTHIQNGFFQIPRFITFGRF